MEEEEKEEKILLEKNIKENSDEMWELLNKFIKESKYLEERRRELLKKYRKYEPKVFYYHRNPPGTFG